MIVARLSRSSREILYQMRFLFLSALALAAKPTDVIENQYIVSFKNNTDFRGSINRYLRFVRTKLEKCQEDLEKKERKDADVSILPITQPTPDIMHYYNFTNYKGMAFKIPKKYKMKVTELLSEHFASIEPDQALEIEAVQTNAPWGLRRLTTKKLPLANSYTYPDHAGSDTFAYVIDTGIRHDHVDFGGRVIDGPNYSADAGNSTGTIK